jgi:hypothetical protein
VEETDVVRTHKDSAIRQIELMYEALGAKDYKKAIYHQKAADLAIDEMMATSSMVTDKE